MGLVYIPIEYEKCQNALEKFDCGEVCYNEFLSKESKNWALAQEGLTYILVEESDYQNNPDSCFIYAYATLSTGGLLERHPDESMIYKSYLEIRLFAVHKKFRHNSDENGVPYSYVFFFQLMCKVWEISCWHVSFKGIFLASNSNGHKLYTDFGFAEIEDYILPTEEHKLDIENCTILAIDNNDELIDKLFLT